MVLKIGSWIDLKGNAGVIVHDVFDGKMCVDRLQMVGQSVVGAPKVVALVLYPSPKIPIPFEEKTMVI